MHVIPLVRYPYKIFYRILADRIRILHIRHTSRRPWTIRVGTLMRGEFRANQVALSYQQMGYNTTQAFHSGDGYYFDVFVDDDNG